jgi:two-component system cell cycle sensor histidine kinase/response regulator CckA
MEQVIMNLCVNARDAMPRGGTLPVAVDETGAEEVPDPTATGRYAVLVVADTGCGMPPETVARVFEPFFTTKPAGEGTGLGLSTIYGIVKQTDGDVSVESEPGRGTTFKVFVPLLERSECDLPSDACREEAEEQPRPLHGTALVVEDDDEVRRLLVDDLREAGLDVIDANGYEGAVAFARGQTGRIDLLVTDMVLKGRDGSDVTRAVREAHPEVKVLCVSGYSEHHLERRGGKSGTDFIQKPFKGEDLAAKVRSMLE